MNKLNMLYNEDYVRNLSYEEFNAKFKELLTKESSDIMANSKDQEQFIPESNLQIQSTNNIYGPKQTTTYVANLPEILDSSDDFNDMLEEEMELNSARNKPRSSIFKKEIKGIDPSIDPQSSDNQIIPVNKFFHEKLQIQSASSLKDNRNQKDREIFDKTKKQNLFDLPFKKCNTLENDNLIKEIKNETIQSVFHDQINQTDSLEDLKELILEIPSKKSDIDPHYNKKKDFIVQSKALHTFTEKINNFDSPENSIKSEIVPVKNEIGNKSSRKEGRSKSRHQSTSQSNKNNQNKARNPSSSKDKCDPSLLQSIENLWLKEKLRRSDSNKNDSKDAKKQLQEKYAAIQYRKQVLENEKSYVNTSNLKINNHSKDGIIVEERNCEVLIIKKGTEKQNSSFDKKENLEKTSKRKINTETTSSEKFKLNKKLSTKRKSRSKEKKDRIITKLELISHCYRDDAWIAIRGIVYDITDFIKVHPGGNVICKAVGTDGTKLFDNVHSHVDLDTIKNKKIGYLET